MLRWIPGHDSGLKLQSTLAAWRDSDWSQHPQVDAIANARAGSRVLLYSLARVFSGKNNRRAVARADSGWSLRFSADICLA